MNIGEGVIETLPHTTRSAGTRRRLGGEGEFDRLTSWGRSVANDGLSVERAAHDCGTRSLKDAHAGCRSSQRWRANRIGAHAEGCPADYGTTPKGQRRVIQASGKPARQSGHDLEIHQIK